MTTLDTPEINAPDLEAEASNFSSKAEKAKAETKLRQLNERFWYPAFLAGKAFEKVTVLSETGYKAPALRDWKRKADIPALILNVIALGVLLTLLSML